ncbi:MAG: hypothetical protein AAEJ04_04695 [Planctomycetota bacterium]
MNQPADKDQESNPPGRPAYARLKDAEQRVAGGGRWSVDGSRRCCCDCQVEIVRGTPFWTVLRPAAADAGPGEGVAAFFSRQDHCESCMDNLQEGEHFARWKTSVPAPEGPPRRIVNIASLHATFLSLLEGPRSTETSSEGGETESQAVEADLESGDAADPPEADFTAADEESDAVEPQLGLYVSQEADRVRLAYLLALFLVRKRALRWEAHEGDYLLVRERSGTLHRVLVPRIDSQALEEAVAEFEELLG